MPEFRGLVRLQRSPMVTGGMGLPARMAARLLTCLQHPAHLLCVKTQTVDCLNPTGTKTMATIIHRRSRAVPLPIVGTPDPIQLHAEAHNALAMAVFYLRQPQANVPGARRKAVQALAALRGLSLSLEG